MSVDTRFRDMLIELEALRREKDALSNGGGGGTSGGVTDDWKASVERELKQLHGDVRRLTGYVFAGAALPFVAVIGLYVYNGTKFDAVDARFTRVESSIQAIAIQQAEARGDLKLLVERTAPKAPR